ncbi:GntR family transcriptional regulator [Streptomyces spiroverticillatus]|uniref:GntR family transcriptional regulator n=1 Tax=Streptomyces finlayi TaxID=67296 RepID=A0A918WSH4_9ACTN|nr:GntR family transcriptional regulator [Streptomyces finlayi]GGZ86775.1 GntR family transcriptional regulator [Streptomyces spiroverticillatus]GHC78240.1 GntR family transcriptional regulator [Streptomyces finlayi]
MLFRLDTGSAVPLGDQVAACVRRAVADGELGPGARLPPARQVAESLGVNVHTVLRGYQRLREEGLVDMRRGRGATVTRGDGLRRAQLVGMIGALVLDARRLGISDEELLDLVRGVLHNQVPPALG